MGQKYPRESMAEHFNKQLEIYVAQETLPVLVLRPRNGREMIVFEMPKKMVGKLPTHSIFLGERNA